MNTTKIRKVMKKKIAALLALCSIAANAPAACDDMLEHELDSDVAFEEAYDLPLLDETQVEANGVKKIPVRRPHSTAFKRTHLRPHVISAEDDCVSSGHGGKMRRYRHELVLSRQFCSRVRMLS